LRLFKAYY